MKSYVLSEAIVFPGALYIAFEQSAAFDAIYMELITDTDKASEFFNGIIPKIEISKLSVVPSETK